MATNKGREAQNRGHTPNQIPNFPNFLSENAL